MERISFRCPSRANVFILPPFKSPQSVVVAAVSSVTSTHPDPIKSDPPKTLTTVQIILPEAKSETNLH